MANLKEVRNRITSVNSTMQITSAMKMVSAAKLKRAQNAITQMRPYAEKLQEILTNVSSSLEASEGGAYSVERDEKNVLIVAITSNRGLCCGFNNNVIKAANRIIAANGDKNVHVLPLGKKAGDFFGKAGLTSKNEGFPESASTIFDELNFANTAAIAEAVMNSFLDGNYDKVLVIYNKFKNAAVQLVTTEQFLPVLPPETSETTSTSDYLFEPSKEEIVTELIPKSLKTQLFKALLDSHASEHGARMTAMHQATDNANDLLKELKLTYNKARQAAITNEILEIVGGAEALNN